jgi:GNAT superfamily N-acetyltransferase
MGETLPALLDDVASGRYPPADGSVTVLPQPSAGRPGVFGFTAHTVIFANVDPGWVRDQLSDGGPAAPLSPQFLSVLCARTGCRIGSIDMLCVAGPLPGPPAVELTPAPATEHPRVARARRYRDEVRAWDADGGVVLLGRGVAARWEVAVEVSPERRNEGLGRRLATAARHLVPDGVPLWAQIAPANAASVRAFLSAGFIPVAAEALLVAP